MHFFFYGSLMDRELLCSDNFFGCRHLEPHRPLSQSRFLARRKKPQPLRFKPVTIGDLSRREAAGGLLRQ
jgi:hypothetical protein